MPRFSLIAPLLVLAACSRTPAPAVAVPARPDAIITHREPASDSARRAAAAVDSADDARDARAPLGMPAPLPAAAADSFLVRFSTSKGDFDVMLRTHWAPLGVARVHEAVSAGYYDRARFFRSLRGFVVQFGIAADPAVTAEWRVRRIPDDPVAQSNRRGTLVFAAGSEDTRTVQLFVNLRDNARLDSYGFAPLGEVVNGMDVVSAIYTGYGEGPPSGTGPSQGAISREGEAMLARDFPLLDQIRTARIIRSWPGGR